jgi:beta-aspartyl-peptidase (threonine type)
LNPDFSYFLMTSPKRYGYFGFYFLPSQEKSFLLPLIIVHGGAGEWKDERIPIGLEYVQKAAEAGFAVLLRGGSALDAAEACTQFMESCGELNAGRGARPNEDGILELDAMIIDGNNLDFGSVAAISGVQNPISLARYIMEKTAHKFFAGPNAKRVYDEMIASGYRKENPSGDIVIPSAEMNGTDTVGCIAIDSKRRIAATSSTGGISKKKPGRVGDSPVMGAGAYATKSCAASATGYGEHIMRVVLSSRVVADIEQGTSVMVAARKGIKFLERITGSEAGIITATVSGKTGYATNAKAMPVVIINGKSDNRKAIIVTRK